MFEGDEFMENIDETSKIIAEYALASGIAEKSVKACAEGLAADQIDTAIEEASKAITLIEKSPHIIKYVADPMVALYAMRAASYQVLGEARMDTHMLHLALDDFNRFEEVWDMLSDEQRAIRDDVVVRVREAKAKVRTLLARLENPTYQMRAPAKKKPWWKFWE